MHKKKVLVLCGSNPKNEWGGSSTFINNIDVPLRKLIDLHYHFLPDHYYKYSHIPKRLLYFIYSLVTLPNMRKSYDLILTHTPEAAYIASFMNVPLIHIFHGNTNPVKISKFWFGKYFQFIFEIFEKRIQNKAIKLFTVGEKKKFAEKINNPIVELELWKGFRKNFYFVGRLEKVKNINRIIDIYYLLPEKIRSQHKLIIIGDGSLKNNLINYANSINLTGKVVFMGFLNNTSALLELKKGLILIMASYHEGFPMAIAEALSLGLPVVSTDVGDINSIIKNGYNGFCLALSELDTVFVDKIQNIINNYEEYSNNALNSSKIFNPEEIANCLIGGFLS